MICSVLEAVPNTLMRSGQVEVCHILIEHALQLLLVEDQQMVKAFLLTLLKKRSQIALARVHDTAF